MELDALFLITKQKRNFMYLHNYYLACIMIYVNMATVQLKYGF